MNETTSRMNVLEPAAASRSFEPLPTPPLPRVPIARGPSFLAGLAHGSPTLAVLALLAGLAWWGHETGWTLPSFADLFSTETARDKDWCEAHGVPESECVECDDSLMPKTKSSWCRKHGVHNCLFERPELAQLKTVPRVTEADKARANRALGLKERPENKQKCTMHQRRIQLASLAAMEKMKIDVAPAWQGPIVETVTASGTITFEQPRVAPLYSPVAGRVWQITPKGTLGAFVQEGEVLALVDAAEIGKAKAEFLQAFGQLDLRQKTLISLKPLVPRGVIAEAKFREAEAAVRESQIRLLSAQQALINLGLPIQYDAVKHLTPEQLNVHILFLGLPPELVKSLDPKTTTGNLIPIKASHAGYLKNVQVVKQDMVDRSKALFVVADTRRMWLNLHVRIEDVKYLRIRNAKTGRPGQQVRFRSDGSDQDVTGELVWKSTTVDDKTCTVQFRAVLPNPDGALLANSFGTGRVLLREEKKAVLVPDEALHWEGDCHVVFVRDKHFLEKGARKVFHVRTVRPGVKNGSNQEIIAGLLPGEVVATRNSANLRAQLLKSNLGAG